MTWRGLDRLIDDIDEVALYEVDVVKPVFQNRNADADGENENSEEDRRTIEQSAGKDPDDAKCASHHQPLQLLTQITDRTA
ncbi:MAG TPA: hypothetical protein VGD55_01895, partial [Acidothermaceae bacterium]